MKNIMKIAGMIGAVLLGTSVVQAGVVTNVWTGNTDSSVGGNANWTGYKNPTTYATTPDDLGDTHIGIINTNGSTAPVVSWGGQINNTVLEVNNTAVLAQTIATLNAVGTTLVLNDAAVYNATGYTMAWGQNAGNASTLTLNDSASLSALHLQVGKISQGVVNQNGGSVALTGDLRLSLDGSASPASRYNLAAGTVTVDGAFSIGGADAGADGGSYFNFTPDSTGSITLMTSNYNFAAKINADQIRVDDTAYTSTDDIWLIDGSVPGQTTLSLSPEVAGVVTNVWTGNTDSSIGNNGNWVGYKNPLGYATTPDDQGDTHIGIINTNGANAPEIAYGGQLNDTEIEVNNSATLVQTNSDLNAIGVTLVLNDTAAYNATGYTMAWGQNAGSNSTLTLNDSASLSALHLQVGKISQGVVNQNGGSVALTGDLRLSLDGSASPASRYNLAAGTVTVDGAFSIGGADAGADGGSYFNFTPDSTGSITLMTGSYDFAAKIDADQIRVDDTAYTSSDDIWLINSSVPGQTTLSLNPNPGLVTQWWTGNTDSAIGNNGNWFGTGNPIGAAGTKIGVIDDNGANAPEIAFGGQLNDTEIEVNNSAVLTLTNDNLNANGVILTLNDNAVHNNTGKTIKWGHLIAGKTSTLTINGNASVSSLHFQLGNISQGIVNQNGGTVEIAGDFKMGENTNNATASRYNLSAGTVTVGDEFDFGGTDAGADGGTYFNFTTVGAGLLTVETNSYDFAARIDSGEIRYKDAVYASWSGVWNVDTNVSGQTTLSVVSEPPAGYAGWIAQYPGVGTATNLTDNPDADALDNLAEWAMGGNPDDIEDIGHVPTFAATEAGGTNYFEYVHAQRSDADELGLSYYLEQTVNLTVPAWTNAYYEVVATNFTGFDFDYVTNRISSDVESVQFLKLIIESN